MHITAALCANSQPITCWLYTSATKSIQLVDLAFLYCWNIWVKNAFSTGKNVNKACAVCMSTRKHQGQNDIGTEWWWKCVHQGKVFRYWVCYTSTRMLLNCVHQDVPNKAINKKVNQMHHYCLNSSLCSNVNCKTAIGHQGKARPMLCGAQK